VSPPNRYLLLIVSSRTSHRVDIASRILSFSARMLSPLPYWPHSRSRRQVHHGLRTIYDFVILGGTWGRRVSARLKFVELCLLSYIVAQ
jgi:hypothetical protein